MNLRVNWKGRIYTFDASESDPVGEVALVRSGDRPTPVADGKRLYTLDEARHVLVTGQTPDDRVLADWGQA